MMMLVDGPTNYQKLHIVHQPLMHYAERRAAKIQKKATRLQTLTNLH